MNNNKPTYSIATPTPIPGYPFNPSPGPMPTYDSRWGAVEASRRFKREPDGTAIVPQRRAAE